jgi:hypothetical protein
MSREAGHKRRSTLKDDRDGADAPDGANVPDRLRLAVGKENSCR